MVDPNGIDLDPDPTSKNPDLNVKKKKKGSDPALIKHPCFEHLCNYYI